MGKEEELGVLLNLGSGEPVRAKTQWLESGVNIAWTNVCCLSPKTSFGEQYPRTQGLKRIKPKILKSYGILWFKKKTFCHPREGWKEGPHWRGQLRCGMAADPLTDHVEGWTRLGVKALLGMALRSQPAMAGCACCHCLYIASAAVWLDHLKGWESLARRKSIPTKTGALQS